MKIHIISLLIFTFTFCSCAGIQVPFDESDSQTEKQGYETYLRIQSTLEACGDTLEYDTLMDVYNSMVRSQYAIPHADQLLKSLIYKRNDNPRIDQMILIFSARILGSTTFPVPDAYGIFESILKMNDSRVNEWVISFVAAAIGDYAFDIPDGDRLVDLAEERLDQIQSIPKGSREYFGYHFMPPPRSDLIRTYIAGIQDQRKREVERRCYYRLILNEIPEIEIEVSLKHIQAEGISETGEKILFPMKYMFLNMDSVFSDLENGQ